MSKFKKFLATGLLVVVSGFSYLGGAIGNIAKSLFSVGSVSAASFNGGNKGDATSVKQGNALSVTGLKSSLKKGDSTTIYFASKTAGNNNITVTDTTGNAGTLSRENLFIEVIDPYGASLTEWAKVKTTQGDGDGATTEAENPTMNILDSNQLEFAEEAETKVGLTLTPKTSGRYKFRFHTKTTEGIWTSTGTYYLDVTSETCELKLQSNDEVAMPTSVNTAKNSTVDISLPLVYGENGDLIKTPILLNKSYVIEYKDVAGTAGVSLSDVSKLSNLPTTNKYSEYWTYTVKALGEGTFTGDYQLNVSVGDADIKYDAITTTETNYGKTPMTFTAENGQNVVTYTLTKGESQVAVTTATVTGSAQYESDNIELVASVSSNLSSLVYKTKNSLNAVSVSNKNNTEESLSTFYFYSATAKVDGVYSTANVVMGKNENGFYIQPNSAVGSSYKIAYGAVDSFGHSATLVTYDKSVSDTDIDNYLITGSYSTSLLTDNDTDEKVASNAEAIEALGNQTYKIPSKVLVTEDADATITIPAVWAYDKSGIATMTRTLETDSSTLVSHKSSTETENVSGYFALTDNEGYTMQPSNLELPYEQNSETERVSITDYIKFVATIDDGSNGTKTVEVYENRGTSTGRQVIGDLIYDENGVQKYLYFVSEGNYYKSGDGSNDVTKATKVDVTEIRNFKNSCDIKLTLSSKIFGAGKYSINYVIKDNASGRRTPSFDFEIVTELEETTPTVTFGDNTVGNVTENQDLKVNIPTIQDDTDERLFVRYYAVVGTEYVELTSGLASGIKTLEFNMTDTKINSASLYEESATSGSFDIVTLAYNSFADTSIDYATYKENLTSNESKNVGIGMGKLTISVKSTDKTAPIMSELKHTGTNPEQYASYSVGGVTFYDNAEGAKVLVEITDTNGNTYDNWTYTDGMPTAKSSTDKPGYDYKYEFNGITFTPTNADKDNYYTVTYKLVDKDGNVTAYSFVLLQVTDKTAPDITIPNTEKRTVEYGQSIEIVYTATDNNSTTTTETVTCVNTATNQDRSYLVTALSGQRIRFDASEIGTYTITITSYDGTDKTTANHSSKSFTIEVKDTLAPTIDLLNSSGTTLKLTNNTYTMSPISETALWENTTTKKAKTITGIPAAIVKDTEPENVINSNLFNATGTMTITTPNKSDGVNEFVYSLDGTPAEGNKNPLNLTLDKAKNSFSFTPFGGSNCRGTYTIVYSATDANGVTATSKTVKISLGDTEKPQIFLTESFEKKLSDGFVLGDNDTLVFNQNAKIKKNVTTYDDEDLYVDDNVGFEYKDGDINTELETKKVTVYVYTPSGSTMTAENDTGTDKLTYKFTTAGTYTIKFSVTDATGSNTQEITRTFVVKAKSTSSVDTSTIVGTVLIVISALILAGIIVYLVRGVKLLPKKNKKSSKNSDKKTDNKTE